MTKYFLFVRKKNYQQKKQVIDEVNKTKSLLQNHAQKSQNQLEKSQRNSARE